MKKAILLMLICLIANIVSGQNLAVVYNCISTSLKDGHSKTDDAFVLVYDGSRSMFYNPEKWAVDSLMSTPEGKAAIQQQVLAQLASGQPLKAIAKGYYICKNVDGTITSYYDEALTGKIYFTEPGSEIEWQLMDDTSKNILGYECQLAQANWHGRNWSAWFAIELPIQEGPWKLCGLPGLILEAEADGGIYSFAATAVGSTRETIPEIIGKEQYDKTDRIKFLKEKRDATDHAMERLKARFGTVKITAPDGTPVTKINVSREVVDFIETDY